MSREILSVKLLKLHLIWDVAQWVCDVINNFIFQTTEINVAFCAKCSELLTQNRVECLFYSKSVSAFELLKYAVVFLCTILLIHPILLKQYIFGEATFTPR